MSAGCRQPSFKAPISFCGRTGLVGGALPSTAKERKLYIQESPKPRMHVIDLVDNCGKHEASRSILSLLSDQATFAVVAWSPPQH